MTAGTHLTSFAANFVRAPRYFSNPMISKKVHSRKALDRRLVIPLDAGNWVRAMEVLFARYAVEGRTGHHVKQILDCATRDVLPHNRRDMVPVIDALRDRCYEGRLPSSPSIWVSLIQSYVGLNALDEAMETVAQWRRRVPNVERMYGYKDVVLKSLLPSLAEVGRLDDMRNVVSLLSGMDQRLPEVERLLRVAEASLGVVPAMFVEVSRHSSSSSVPLPPASSIDQPPKVSTSGEEAFAVEEEVDIQKLKYCQSISMSALHTLVLSLAKRIQWKDALASMKVLQRRRGEGEGGTDENVVLPQDAPMLRAVCNAMGAASKWELCLALWQGDGCLLNSKNNNTKSNKFVALDRVLVSMVLHSLPQVPHEAADLDDRGNVKESVEIATASSVDDVKNVEARANNEEEEEPNRFSGRAYPHMLPLRYASEMHSGIAVRILDTVCFKYDEWEMDNICGSKFVQALLEQGDWSRALHVVGTTPLLRGYGRMEQKPGQISAALEKKAEQHIAHMLYWMHHNCGGQATKRFCVERYPFAFPKDRFDSLMAEASLTTKDSTAATTRRSPGGSSKHKSTTQLTEDMEVALREGILRFARNKPLMEFAGDANKDPRPIPKGLHDTASGWNYVGRGGEKMFANSRKYASVLSSAPKHMAALRNPLRGWNPKQNSSHAHRELVWKWNGRSAV